MVTPDDLRRVPLFAAGEEEGLEWICAHGKEVWLAPGEANRAQGAPADIVFILLDGKIRITQRVGNQDVILITYDTPTLYGEIPLLMGTPNFWAQGRAMVRSHLLEVPSDVFWHLLMRCPKLLTETVRMMAERVQAVQAVSQQRERLAGLGTMAAGLAHEINNPASAARRAAQQLSEILKTSRKRACKLGAADWTPAQRAYLVEIQDDISAYCRLSNPLDTLELSDREEAVAAWLDQHAFGDSWELAPTLVSAGLDTPKLNALAAQIPPTGLEDALAWIANGATIDGLVVEMQTCAERIIHLVEDVKAYTYLDRGEQQEIDVREGLESTLAMLAPQLGNTEIIREYAPDLPRICAYGGELNQVWTHLLTNAVDAVQSNGKIWIKTLCEGPGLLVEIANNGPEIPPDIMEHIFEPFFTTKDIGVGSGLGLVVTRRIVVDRHGGDLRAHSEPGYTCFEVRLPFQQAEARA